MWQVVAVSIVPASVGLVCAIFRHDMQEARARLAAQPTRIFHSTYGDIQYWVTGEGVPILVSHGITGGVDQAESLITKSAELATQPPVHLRLTLRLPRVFFAAQGDGENAGRRVPRTLDHLTIDRVFLVGNSAGGPSATWFTIGYPERTQGLILLSSAVPSPVPDPIPPLVAKHDFVYWAAVKAAPGSLLGMLMPKSVIQNMSKEDKAEAIELSLLASMPISQRTEGIRFDNEVTGSRYQ